MRSCLTAAGMKTGSTNTRALTAQHRVTIQGMVRPPPSECLYAKRTLCRQPCPDSLVMVECRTGASREFRLTDLHAAAGENHCDGGGQVWPC
jgi:hypothetical protein